MFEQLQVSNFQSHQDTTLDFVPGVNIIVGDNNAGKTSLVRALNWVINGRPRGSGIMRWGEKHLAVSLVLSSGDDLFGVSRIREGNKARYELVVGSDDAVTFGGVGSEVPEEVRKAVNFADVNMQDQLLPYFLVLDSPGKVALAVNQATRVEELDRIGARLAEMLREVDRDIKKWGEELVLVGEGIAELEKLGLGRMEELLKKAERLEKGIETGRTRGVSLHFLLLELGDITREKEAIPLSPYSLETMRSNRLDYGEAARRTGGLSAVVQALDRVYIELTTIPRDCREEVIQGDRMASGYKEALRVGPLRTCISALASIYIALKLIQAYEKPWEETRQLKERYYKLDDLAGELSDWMLEMDDCHEDLAEWKGNLDAKVKDLASIAGSLETCPFCGQEIDDVGRSQLVGMEGV